MKLLEPPSGLRSPPFSAGAGHYHCLLCTLASSRSRTRQTLISISFRLFTFAWIWVHHVLEVRIHFDPICFVSVYLLRQRCSLGCSCGDRNCGDRNCPHRRELPTPQTPAPTAPPEELVKSCGETAWESNAVSGESCIKLQDTHRSPMFTFFFETQWGWGPLLFSCFSRRLGGDHSA